MMTSILAGLPLSFFRPRPSLGGEGDGLVLVDDVLVAVFVGNGHLALQDEVDLLQGVVVVGPVSAAVGLELGHTDPELLGAVSSLPW